MFDRIAVGIKGFIQKHLYKNEGKLCNTKQLCEVQQILWVSDGSLNIFPQGTLPSTSQTNKQKPKNAIQAVADKQWLHLISSMSDKVWVKCEGL